MQVCHVYAIIKEESRDSKTVCSSQWGSSVVYTSTSNMVEVRLVVRAQDEKDNHFLLKYEGKTCTFMECTFLRTYGITKY